MEPLQITVDWLDQCALHPDTWLSWAAPVIEHLPFDTRVSISCVPGDTWLDFDQKEVWVVRDITNTILWSSYPVEIVPDEGQTVVKNIFAMIQKVSDNPDPPLRAA